MKKYLFMMMAALLSLPIAAQEQPKNNISVQVDTNVQKPQIFIRGRANIETQVKNLYIIDGVVKSKEDWDRIPKEEIKSLNTLRNVEQVFVIETNAGSAIRNLKMYNPTFRKLSGTYVGSKTIIADSALKAKDPTFFVKANYSSKPLWITKDEKGKFKVISEKEIHDMNTKSIKTMTIFKDSEAEPYKKYGDISNGVVVIEFKNK